MHYRYDNVITLRTFSKIYGLAGVRIGYGFAHEELIRNLLKVKLPFEPSTPAQAAGIGALADKEFLHRSLELNARGLRYLTEGLAEPGTDGGAVAGEFRDDRSAHRAGRGAHFRGAAVAGRGGASAEGLRPAQLHPHFHRHGRRQPPVYRSMEEELCRKRWSSPRRLSRISFR